MGRQIRLLVSLSYLARGVECIDRYVEVAGAFVFDVSGSSTCSYRMHGRKLHAADSFWHLSIACMHLFPLQ